MISFCFRLSPFLIRFAYEFGFSAVLVYIIKWDILDLWLSYNIEDAQVRFDELVTEVTDTINTQRKEKIISKLIVVEMVDDCH
jgi:hypothetical protein